MCTDGTFTRQGNSKPCLAFLIAKESWQGAGQHFPRRAAEEERSTLTPLQHRLLREDSDHLVALWGHHSLPCVLLTVDLIFHEEMSFLLEVGAAVTAHVALRVTLLVPNLHKHPSGEGTSTQHQLSAISPSPLHLSLPLVDHFPST